MRMLKPVRAMICSFAGGGGAILGTSKGRQQLLPKFLRLPWCLWPGASYFFSLGLFSYLKNGWSLWRVICSSRSDFLWQIQYWKTRVCRIRGVLLLCNRGGTEFRDNRVVFMLPSVAPRTLTSSLSLPWEDKNVGGGQLLCLEPIHIPILAHLWFLFFGHSLFASPSQINPCWSLSLNIWLCSVSWNPPPPFFLKPHTKLTGIRSNWPGTGSESQASPGKGHWTVIATAEYFVLLCLTKLWRVADDDQMTSLRGAENSLRRSHEEWHTSGWGLLVVLGHLEEFFCHRFY